MCQEQKITQKTRWNFSPHKNKHTFLHTIGFSHPAAETNKCKETGREAPTIQEGTYQTHR
jgi:hypothetical protein